MSEQRLDLRVRSAKLCKGSRRGVAEAVKMQIGEPERVEMGSQGVTEERRWDRVPLVVGHEQQAGERALVEIVAQRLSSLDVESDDLALAPLAALRLGSSLPHREPGAIEARTRE